MQVLTGEAPGASLTVVCLYEHSIAGIGYMNVLFRVIWNLITTGMTPPSLCHVQVYMGWA